MTSMVNDVWVGDHCQLDLFVIGQEGRIVRPWLSAWLDVGSGYLVGWALSAEPTRYTLTQAFARAMAMKPGDPVRGLPKTVCVDSGAFYISVFLENGMIDTKALGHIDRDIETNRLYKVLGVQVCHGKAYQGWMKLIERCFDALREGCYQKLPGCFGEFPASREGSAEIARAVRAMNLRRELLTINELADWFAHAILSDYHHNTWNGDETHTPATLYSLLPKARGDVPDAETLINLLNEVRAGLTQGNDSSQSEPKPEDDPPRT